MFNAPVVFLSWQDEESCTVTFRVAVNTNKHRRHSPERALIPKNRHEPTRFLRLNSLFGPACMNDAFHIAKTHRQAEKRKNIGPVEAPVRTDCVSVSVDCSEIRHHHPGWKRQGRFQRAHFRRFYLSAVLFIKEMPVKLQSCSCVVFLWQIFIRSNCVCNLSRLDIYNKSLLKYLNESVDVWFLPNSCHVGWFMTRVTEKMYNI